MERLHSELWASIGRVAFACRSPFPASYSEEMNGLVGGRSSRAEVLRTATHQVAVKIQLQLHGGSPFVVEMVHRLEWNNHGRRQYHSDNPGR
jgi:hypothetical protein